MTSSCRRGSVPACFLGKAGAQHQLESFSRCIMGLFTKPALIILVRNIDGTSAQLLQPCTTLSSLQLRAMIEKNPQLGQGRGVCIAIVKIGGRAVSRKLSAVRLCLKQTHPTFSSAKARVLHDQGFRVPGFMWTSASAICLLDMKHLLIEGPMVGCMSWHVCNGSTLQKSL